MLFILIVPNQTFVHFSNCTFMVPYLHTFSALVLFGTNSHFTDNWCKFSIIFRKIGAVTAPSIEQHQHQSII